MKFTAEKQRLLSILTYASKAVGNNSIMQGVELTADEDIKFVSTNLDMTIIQTEKFNVKETGRAVIPAKILSNIVRQFPEGSIEFEQVDNQMKIFKDKISFSVSLYAADEFPAFAEFKPIGKTTMKFGEFRMLSQRAIKAASTEEARAVLTGVLFEGKGDFLNVSSTDSYRLFSYSEAKQVGEFRANIPAKTLDTVTRHDNPTSEILIEFSESEIRFTLGQAQIVSRLLAGKYPDVEALMKGDYALKAIMSKEALINAIRRTSAIGSKETPIFLDFKDNVLKLSQSVKEIGSAENEIGIQFEGEIKMAFNPEFLIDGLNMSDYNEAIIEMNEPLKPALITGHENYQRYLIMPIRGNN